MIKKKDKFSKKQMTISGRKKNLFWVSMLKMTLKVSLRGVLTLKLHLINIKKNRGSLEVYSMQFVEV